MLPVLNKTNYLPSYADDFFGDDFLSGIFGQSTGVSKPAVNIKEDKEDFKIEVAAPGLSKKDFKVDIDNDVLTISSVKKDEKEEKDGEKYMRREFSYSSFKRSFSLPETVDSDKIKAAHKDGVLEITIPKRNEAKVKPPRSIDIS
jgi:HSP20 family protein